MWGSVPEGGRNPQSRVKQDYWVYHPVPRTDSDTGDTGCSHLCRKRSRLREQQVDAGTVPERAPESGTRPNLPQLISGRFPDFDDEDTQTPP